MASIPAAAASSQNVVLPVIPELTNPNFLDILLPAPAPEAGILKEDSAPVEPTNPLMEALEINSHRTVTTNDAKAYDSTLDPVLDAFYTMRPWSEDVQLQRNLRKSWAVDPESTLKIIWNARSIHDGKGTKEIFYRWVINFVFRRNATYHSLSS